MIWKKTKFTFTFFVPGERREKRGKGGEGDRVGERGAPGGGSILIS